jgi:hypothetical protein
LDRVKTVENYNAVLEKFAEIRACAVLRTATSEACPKAMQAAIDGGFKITEFTLTTPDCLQHLSDFRQKYDGDVMVGWYVRPYVNCCSFIRSVRLILLIYLFQ